MSALKIQRQAFFTVYFSTATSGILEGDTYDTKEDAQKAITRLEQTLAIEGHKNPEAWMEMWVDNDHEESE